MTRRFRKKTRSPKTRLKRDNLRKGIYILPNLFTSAGLFVGFYSIIATMNGDFKRAAWAIIIAGLCDVADGRIARMTATTSRFGVEYDSLADLLSFGLAPGLLVYVWALKPYGKWGWSAAFIYVVCAALRLARYNVQIDNIESVSFNGLPVPAAAGIIVTTVLLFFKFELTGPIRHPAILVVIFLLGFLMVSNIKFSSFKELELRKRKPFPVLVGIIVLLVLIVNEPQIVLFSIALLYLLHGPARTCVLWRKRHSSQNAENREIADQTEQGPASNKE